MSDSKSKHTSDDPMEMLRQMWASVGMPLPGMPIPTVDIEELDKRIADLRTVEGWLEMNLQMLRMTVQGLEAQRNTLATMKEAAGKAGAAPSDTNPFAGLWPWAMMTNPAAFTPPEAGSTPPDDKRKPSGGGKR